MSKPMVLFVAGLLSDQRVWQSTIDGLTGFNVLIADNQSDDRISSMAERALSMTDEPLIVVGHSMGGRVALEMARMEPDQVLGLVLANTGHTGQKPGELAKRQAKIDLGYHDIGALAAQWLPPMLAAGRETDEDLMQTLTEMVLTAGAQVNERQIMALVNRPSATEYLPEIDCPTLLLTGLQDRWSPVAQHEEIQALMPNATLELVDAAGHFMPIEQPEETSRLISAWVKKHHAK